MEPLQTLSDDALLALQAFCTVCSALRSVRNQRRTAALPRKRDKIFDTYSPAWIAYRLRCPIATLRKVSARPSGIVGICVTLGSVLDDH